MNMTKAIYFDMDGTIADLYGVEGWLNDLESENERPYATAKPLIRMSALARVLNRLHREGNAICIISWTAKNGSAEFNARVAEAKRNWLAKHLASVEFDKIHIVPYGTPKEKFCESENDILFDDEMPNRNAWTGNAYGVENILEILKNL